MHPSVACHAPAARKPLIRFLGKRMFPATPDPPHAHPAAPLEFKQRFSEFLSKRQNPSTSSSMSPNSAKAGPNTLTYEFWEMPSRLWTRRLEDKEIAAIMSGGASAY